MDYTAHGILQARTLEWVAGPSSRMLSQPRSPALQEDCLPAEPPGKPFSINICQIINLVLDIQSYNTLLPYVSFRSLHLSEGIELCI